MGSLLLVYLAASDVDLSIFYLHYHRWSDLAYGLHIYLVNFSLLLLADNKLINFHILLGIGLSR